MTVVAVEGTIEVVAEGADIVGDTEAANNLRSGVDSFNRGAWQKLEQMSNWAKGRFEALDGTKRIADNLAKESGKIGESKSMNYVSLTKQIRDYLGYAEKNRLNFVLRVWKGTKLSGPLQALVKSGKVTLEEISKPIPH